MNGKVGRLAGWAVSFVFVFLVDRLLTPFIPFFPIRLLADAAFLFLGIIVLVTLVVIAQQTRRSRSNRPDGRR